MNPYREPAARPTYPSNKTKTKRITNKDYQRLTEQILVMISEAIDESDLKWLSDSK